ncbi:MAG: helix-turn-helix transcriptional regulator [Stappiaceae bacterium]
MSVLDRKKAERVKDALSALAVGSPSAGVWEALPALSRLSETGHDIAIDFRATDLIGAPVVIATERKGRIESAPSVLDCLTARQKDVARSMARGLSNKQIARALSISIPTTKDHVHAVLKKLKLTSRNQLAALLYGPDLNG